MKSQAVTIVDGGKMLIPAQFRRELGLGVGDTVVVELDGGELRVRSLSAAIRHAQSIVRSFVPVGTSLSDQLVADRLNEAADEGRPGA